MSNTQKQRVDLYSRITDRIVEDLAKDVRPWMKPWNAESTTRGITRPLRQNGQPYSGVNVLLVWSEGNARGYTSSTWMTFKQALELGAAVREGETGATVVFSSHFTKSERDAAGTVEDRRWCTDKISTFCVYAAGIENSMIGPACRTNITLPAAITSAR